MFDWKTLPQPIFGLAPMDGVTDSVFRSIVYRHGPPDVLFTEFVSAEGLARRIPALFQDLRFEPNERPMIAQIFGCELQAFAEAVPLLAELGFDGVDINMGCPAKNVVHRGGGAALIQAADHAKKIIRVCHQELLKWFEKTGRKIPLSVKTRLGYNTVSVKEWIGTLLECEELSNISIHGRTFRQSYSGNADWDGIAQAVELAKGRKVSILGNGDLTSFSRALDKIRQTGVNGVLFGRATYGAPWFFREKEKFRASFRPQSPPTEAVSVPECDLPTRIRVLLEHAELLSARKDPRQFIQIRKHAGWYLKGFPGASELRARLSQVQSLEELQQALSLYY